MKTTINLTASYLFSIALILIGVVFLVISIFDKTARENAHIIGEFAIEDLHDGDYIKGYIHEYLTEISDETGDTTPAASTTYISPGVAIYDIFTIEDINGKYLTVYANELNVGAELAVMEDDDEIYIEGKISAPLGGLNYEGFMDYFSLSTAKDVELMVSPDFSIVEKSFSSAIDFEIIAMALLALGAVLFSMNGGLRGIVSYREVVSYDRELLVKAHSMSIYGDVDKMLKNEMDYLESLYKIRRNIKKDGILSVWILLGGILIMIIVPIFELKFIGIIGLIASAKGLWSLFINWDKKIPKALAKMLSIKAVPNEIIVCKDKIEFYRKAQAEAN